MCTSESKINKKFTITTQHPTASHRISHLSFTRVPSSLVIRWKNSFHFSFLQTLNQFVLNEKNETIRSVDFLTNPNLLLFRNQVMTIK
jgi:hypothetical protein